MGWLIQRVIRRDSSYGNGIDSKFAFDYMGSSEFEYGEIPRALKAMREACNDSWEVKKITARDYKAWFVGDPSQRQMVSDLFWDQLGDLKERDLHFKEQTYIHETFYGHKDNWATRCTGWWGLDWDPPFIFFKKKEDAELWLELLKNSPKKKDKK